MTISSINLIVIRRINDVVLKEFRMSPFVIFPNENFPRKFNSFYFIVSIFIVTNDHNKAGKYKSYLYLFS